MAFRRSLHVLGRAPKNSHGMLHSAFAGPKFLMRQIVTAGENQPLLALSAAATLFLGIYLFHEATNPYYVSWACITLYSLLPPVVSLRLIDISSGV